PRSLTICALGPLTNIAMALVKAPEIAAGIAELVVMGGASQALGNMTPAAEFNIHADPLAAALVFDSAVPITLIPLDLTHQVPADFSRFSPSGSRACLEAGSKAGLCGAGGVSLVCAGHSSLEECDDHRDAHLSAKTGLDPRRREPLRRGAARPRQGLPARRL